MYEIERQIETRLAEEEKADRHAAAIEAEVDAAEAEIHADKYAIDEAVGEWLGRGAKNNEDFATALYELLHGPGGCYAQPMRTLVSRAITEEAQRRAQTAVAWQEREERRNREEAARELRSI